MASLREEIESRRTFAIISHPDAGKTTLTEKLLLYGGAIQTAGSVKGKQSAKHAVSDWMDIEKQRGISVTSSVLQFHYQGKCINICVKTATNDEPTTTIQPNGWEALIETMQTLKERGLEYECFNGLDMFQFDSLETMWEWVNDKN